MTQRLQYFPQKVPSVSMVIKWVCHSLYPTGRLYQVEYAMEAIGHAGTCLGIVAKDGILLAAERKNTNKLLDEVIFSEKIYRLHRWEMKWVWPLCNHSNQYFPVATWHAV